MSISSASIPGISTSMEKLFLDSTILQAGLKSLFTKGMLDKTGSSKKRWNMPSNSFLKRFNGNSSGFIFFGFIVSSPILYKLTIYILPLLLKLNNKLIYTHKKHSLYHCYSVRKSI